MEPPRFVSELDVRKIGEASAFGRARWRLLAPLVYDSLIVGRVDVPAGFETDFASVPRLPLAYALFGDTEHEAAVVHDHLVTRGEPWARAADVFREAMLATGRGRWRAGAMYAAVRLAGLWRGGGRPADQPEVK